MVKRLAFPEDDPPAACIKLDKELTAAFCKLVKKGLPFDGVCDYLGIHTSSFWHWLRKGEEYLDGGGAPKAYRPYGLFVIALRKAHATYRLRLVDGLHDYKLWKRWAWILERRDRKNFSKQEPEGGNMEDFDPDDRYL